MCKAVKPNGYELTKVTTFNFATLENSPGNDLRGMTLSILSDTATKTTKTSKTENSKKNENN